jgi:FtsP/CotA-like multicopper oxidase with cupredoxin domain
MCLRSWQCLTGDAAKPALHLCGWKGSVLLAQGNRYRLAMHCHCFVGTDLSYMCRCHLVQHEDEGRMGQFVVLAQGHEVGIVPWPRHSL